MLSSRFAHWKRPTVGAPPECGESRRGGGRHSGAARGLYLEDRGAHNYWLTQDEVAQRPDGLINQIHYQDAAAAAVAALFRGKPGDVLLAADDAPMTREDICRAATRMRRFAGKGVPRFTGSSGGVGKIIDCSHTRDAIGWEPRFKTFDAFADSVS